MEIVNIQNEKDIRVIVIGAGPTGLAVVRHLKDIATVECFEAQKQIGGQWSMEQFKGYSEKETSQYQNMYGTQPVSTYEDMITNIPVGAMTFKEFPPKIPAHTFIRINQFNQYLQSFSKEMKLDQLIKLNHLVKHVRLVKNLKTEGEIQEFNLKQFQQQEKRKFVAKIVQNDDSSKTQIRFYDYVIVCNGRYSVPKIPTIPGFQNFKGESLHSHELQSSKKFQSFQGKTVLIIGFGGSGQDILGLMLESKIQFKLILQTAVNPIILSTVLNSTLYQPAIDSNKLKIHASVIMEIDSDGNFIMNNGQVIKDVDVLLYCTGYKISFPFLSHADGIINGKIVDKDRSQVFGPLYKGIFATNCTEVMFMGIFSRMFLIVLFFQRQATVIKHSILQGHDKFLPSKEIMEEEFYETLKSSFALNPNGNLMYAFQLDDSPHKPRFTQYCRQLAEMVGMKTSPEIEQVDKNFQDYNQPIYLAASSALIKTRDQSTVMPKNFLPTLEFF